MNVVTNDNIQAAIALNNLHEVIDPEIGLNVVDLGLIYQLDFNPEKSEIACIMTLTTQFCPMGEAITTGVKENIEQTFPDYSVDVTLTFDPPWNYGMISEQGHSFLGR